MTADLHEIGLNAVDAFITTFNSRDPEAWAGSLHFPHVRPSPFGPINVTDNASDYIKNVDYARLVETGWDHSEWDYKRVLHVSNSKMHVAGQWSRFDANGNRILTTPIVYIVTKVEGLWGIQSRFGCDFAADDDTLGMETRAFKLLETFENHVNQGNFEALKPLLNLPFVQVEPGRLRVNTTREKFSMPMVRFDIIGMFTIQAGHHSANLGLNLGIESLDGIKREFQAVVNVTDREGHLGIQAFSFLDPLEVDP